MLYDPADSLTAEAVDLWAPGELVPGKAFIKPSPLFVKLDASIVEEERARLGS
jgi:hypothetical protein